MTNDTNAPATDDQELANMLAGLNNDGSAPGAPVATVTTPTVDPVVAPITPTGLQFEPTPPAIVPTSTVITPSVTPVGASVDANPELAAIKKDALSELRPLVDKLDLPADEKFDTLLLIIRSTDDQTLLKPAHEAAKNIADESKRAQALLDIIKEIDFFGNATK